ncbi:uncharacterized protein LOC134291334 [Aedes albopictus]|uniref:Uncharacterized protein n=1 Tax=Aedes albopictus TaxID=7160 RepID=A0ABM1Z1E8_AEDAL
MTPLEEACEEHFRYMVRLPVRNGMVQLLGDSFAVVQRRFWTIERKFAANSESKSEYVKFIEEYAALGHMELSPRVEIPQLILPHHATFCLDSSTTKTRVVFDATCKSSSLVAGHTSPMNLDSNPPLAPSNKVSKGEFPQFRIPQLADPKIPRRVLTNDFKSYTLHCF